MAIGTYSSILPSNVDIQDVDIFYLYIGDRTNINNFTATKLDSTLLTKISDNTNQNIDGLYRLNLPATVFNQVGFYYVFIKPKSVNATIVDCGVLQALPDRKGILLNISDPELAPISRYLTNDGLTGFQIQYFDEANSIRPNLDRIVTSSNLAEAVADNTANSVNKSIKYRFTDIGNLLFLTLTPSNVSSIKPTAKPFLGNAGDRIRITNTFFEPVLLEVEFANHDFDTLSIGLFGEAIKNVQTGKLTFYDDERNIFDQVNLFEIQDDFGNPLYEVREKPTTLDEGEDFDIITGQI